MFRTWPSSRIFCGYIDTVLGDQRSGISISLKLACEIDGDRFNFLEASYDDTVNYTSMVTPLLDNQEACGTKPNANPLTLKETRIKFDLAEGEQEKVKESLLRWKDEKRRAEEVRREYKIPSRSDSKYDHYSEEDEEGDYSEEEEEGNYSEEDEESDYSEEDDV